MTTVDANYEQAEPFIARWLADQRDRLTARLHVCGSPVEVLFAIAMLSTRHASDLIFDLAPPSPTQKQPLLAASEALGLRLYAQHQVVLAGKRCRVDFTITGGARKIAVEIDGHDFHASKHARSADAARDLALTKAGWTPVRFTGSDIWRNADECAARTLDLLGVTTAVRGVVRPAEKRPPARTDPTLEQSRAGAVQVLAALGASERETDPVIRPRLPALRRR